MEHQFILQIKDNQFTRLANFVRELSGIDLKPHKLSLVQNRLGKYVKGKGFGSIDSYISHLIDHGTKADKDDVLDLITTNFTSFYREKEHFQFLSDKIKANQIGPTQGNTIRIWSAACSSGEEPYSIAMELQELKNNIDISYKILASDVSPQILSTAKEGVYQHKKIQNVNPFLLTKYFVRESRNKEMFYRANDILKKCIHFTRINLLMNNIPFRSKFNFVFCRNVMIYFNKETQSKIINNLYNYLEPGGYLFLGHSESLTGMKQPFDYVQPSVYRKGGRE